MEITIAEKRTGSKRFATTLKAETLIKLQAMKSDLKEKNPRITLSDLIEMALEDLFTKYKLTECEKESIIPVIIKEKGYKVNLK